MEIERISATEHLKCDAARICLDASELAVLKMAVRERLREDVTLSKDARYLLESLSNRIDRSTAPVNLETNALSTSFLVELMFEAIEMMRDSCESEVSKLFDQSPDDGRQAVEYIPTYVARIAVSSKMLAEYDDARMADVFYRQLDGGYSDEWRDNQ